MDENNLNPAVDTTLWTMPTTSPTPVDVTKSTLPFDNTTLPNIKDISPDISALVGSIRFDSANKMSSTANSREDLLNKLFPNRGKIDLTTEVPLEATHEQLTNGTWIPKYSSYVPGIDNDSRLSAQQTDWQKFFNPIKRFVANTSKAPLDLASGVYGIGAAALTGRFDAIYDNDFAHFVDDWTTRTNAEYKNYYNEKERNQDLGMNLQTWDKVLGGAEFTARMLASEAILAIATDGASLPGTLAKAGLKAGSLADKAADTNRILQVGKDIARMMKIAQAPELATAAKGGNVASSGSRMLGALETAANRGKMGDALVKARFAITSPMYEAGFEARHFQKEAEQQFWDYYNQRGIQPTPEEVSAFGTKLAGASNGVFMANMAILAPSNLALVGDFIHIKNPLSKWVTSSSEGITRNVFKIGTEVGKDGTYQAIKAGFWNKTAAYATPFIKGALVEGVWEEGSQGIASNTYKNYVASSYNPEAMKSTAGYINSFAKAFQDQFGTKEGMEEVIIGALIGGLMGGIGGARTTARQYNAQKQVAAIQNAGTAFADNLRSNIYTNEQLLSLFSSAGRFQDIRQQLETADQQGDKLKQASLQAQSFVSLLDAYQSVGKGSEFTNMVQNVFQGIDNQYIADNTGLNINEVDQFKQDQISDMNDLSEKYSTALEAGRYLFGNKVGGFTEVDIDGKKTKVSGQNLANALAFSSTMALFNEKFAADTFNAFQVKLGQLSVGNDIVEKMGAIGAIKKASAIDLESYYSLNQQETTLKNKLNTITDKINQLNAGEEKTASAIQRVQFANQLTQIQQQISDVSSRKDVLWKSMVDNFYSKMGKQGYAPQIDLETFSKQVKDIETSLQNANYSADDKLVLNQLLDQFDQANSAYKSFTDMANKITDPKMSFKTYNHLFGGLRAKFDKSINEHTKETLLQLYGQTDNFNTSEALAQTTQVVQSPITQEVIDAETEPTTDLIAYVNNKLKSILGLNALEKEFYNKYKDQIDTYESDPLNSESSATEISQAVVELNAKIQEIQNFNNGIYSDDLQSEISKLRQEIEDLGGVVPTVAPVITEEVQETLNVDPVTLEDIQARRQEEIDKLPLLPLNLEDDPELQKRIDARDQTLADINERYDTEIANLPRVEQEEVIPEVVPTPVVEEEIVDNSEKITELETEIKNKIEQERIKLEDELAVLEGETTDEQRRQRIEDEIAQVRAEIIDEIGDKETEADVQHLLNNSQVTIDKNFGKTEQEIRDLVKDPAVLNSAKIQRLLELQRELAEMDKVKTPFNANGTPLEQLEWVIDNISDLNFETVEDLANIQRPTQDLVDEYIDLLNTRNRNKTQKARLGELRQELLPFNLAEGLALDGVNVLDIIDLYNQNKRIQEVQDTQLAELPENDLKTVVKEAQQETKREEFRSAKVGLVYDGAYIERKKNGYKIYHIKLNTMLEESLNNDMSPEIIVYGEDSEGKKVVVEEIIVTPENMIELGNKYDGVDNIKVVLSDEVAVVKNKNDKSFYIKGEVNGLLGLLGAAPYAITGQPTNYVLLYKQNLDGSLQPREAEFSIMNQGVEMNFDKETLNSIKPGDVVTLEFDPQDDFNKQLHKSDYNSQGRIYVKKNGKLVNILKGTDVSKSERDSWTELEAIRQKAVKAGLATKNKKTINVKVDNSYLGFPIITLNSDGTAKELPIDESKVVAYGYIDENGQLHGEIANIKIDNEQYITPLSTTNKKTPIMAFNAYGKVIAFPINLKPKGVDLTADVDNIINNEELSRERKIFEINSILENNGMFNTDLALSNNNFDINKVKEALTSVYQSIDITDVLEFNQADKTAFIDLNDPFKSSKLVLDFGSVEEELLATEKDAKQTVKKTTSSKNKKGKNESDNNKC